MRRWTIRILLVLVALAVVLWLALPSALQFTAAQLARVQGIEEFQLEISEAGWRSVTARHLRFRMNTSYGPVRVSLDDATVGYDLFNLFIRQMRAARGAVDWTVVPPATASGAATLPLLPALSGRIEQFTLTVRTPSGAAIFKGPLETRLHPRDGLRVRLRGDKELLTAKLDAIGSKFDLELRDGADEPLVHVSATDPLGTRTAVALDARPATLLRWMDGNAALDAGLRDPLAAFGMSGGRFKARAQYRQASDDWDIEEIDALWDGLTVPGYRSSGQLTARATPSRGEWTMEILRPSRLMATLTDAGGAVSSIDVDITPQTKSVLRSVPDQGWSIDGSGDIALTLKLPEERVLNTTVQQWRWKPGDQGDARLVTSNAMLNSPALGIARIEIDARNSAQIPLAGGDVRLQRIGPPPGPDSASGFDATAQWKRLTDAVKADARVSMGRTPIGQARFQWNTGQGKWAADVDIDTAVAPVFDTIKGFFPALASAVLTQGKLRGTVRLHGTGKAPGGSVKFSLTDFVADYSEMRLTGRSATVVVPDLARPVARFDLRFPEIETARAGRITGLFVNGNWKSGVIQVDDGGFGIYNGSLRVAPTSITVDGESEVRLTVTDLDLEQMFKQIDISGLSGTGMLGGVLPLRIHGRTVEIIDGDLHTNGAGVLRYLSGDAPGPDENIALKALRDFRYDNLTARVSYTRDGTYTLKSRVEGRNPALYNGYPIAFNINLTGQLPGILAATLVTGDFDQEILKRVRTETGGITAPVAAPDGPAR